MPTTFKLSIPHPCSQNWSEMLPAESGLYCESCSKCVHDFSEFSDEQLQKYFTKSSGDVCGRFSQLQLDKYLNASKDSSSKKSFTQLLLSAVLLAGFTGRVNAKTTPVPSVQVQLDSQSIVQSKPLEENGSDNSLVIRGTIRDEKSMYVIPFASISIKDTKFGVISDIDGNFEMKVSDSLAGKEITLLITTVGYDRKEMQMLAKDFPLQTEIYLHYGVTLAGAVVIVRKPSLWQRIFHRKKTECK